VLRWRLGRLFGGIRSWPDQMNSVPGPAPPSRADGAAIRITFVNHSTTLLQTAGVNVLTDPMWSERVSPIPWLGPRRCRPPGIRFADLPKVSIVLVSHCHYDHLDVPTLRALTHTHTPLFITGLGNKALLERQRIGPVIELDWWQEAALPGDLKVTCVPARHSSARGLWDRDRTLWCGFVLHGPGGRVYFAGDTGYGDHFAEIADKLGPPRLALLPIGAHLPRWFVGRVHLAPEEALSAHQVLRAQTSVAIHFGTFLIADDGPDQALVEFVRVRAQAGQSGFWVLDFGEGRDIP
jgi:L-ascorbate metabolism protein UlaG (beta-lactamase superfamily)